MQQPNPFNKIKKYFTVFMALFFLFEFNSFVFTQSNSAPLSVCELLQNKKKYRGKEILLEGFLEIAPETSTFKIEENCPVIESVAVGTHDSFQSDDRFEKATDLLSLQSIVEKKSGISLKWKVFLRVKVKVEGILQTSNKPKFGHLNSYKNLFLITKPEEIGQSQLISIGDIFSKDPKIIVTNDNE